MTPEPTGKIRRHDEGRGETDLRTTHSSLSGSYDVTPPDLQGLLEPDAGRLASPVLRGAGRRERRAYPTETQLRDDGVLTTDEQADALGRVGISSAFTAASGRCGGGVIPKTKTRSVRSCRAMSQGLRVAGERTCSGSPAGQPKPRP